METSEGTLKIAIQDKNVRAELLICILLAVLILFVYLPVINHDFINYDDYEYVVENIHINKGFSINGIRWSFFSFYMSNWHPFTWLSHMLDCQIFGLDPGWHHVTNVFFHIINAVLLFFVFYRSTDKIWPGTFAAVFFAMHPMHVESVAWIAERKDVLSTFFMLITFYFYIDWVKNQKRLKYWIAVISFLLGLMSKPMIITLPFLLLLFDYWPLQRLFPDNNNKKSLSVSKTMGFAVIEKIPFFILSGFSGLITVIAQKHGGAIGSVDIYPLSLRMFNAAVSYVEYIKKFFCPIRLAIPYPYPEKIQVVATATSFSILIAVTFLTIYAARKKPFLITGWLWYLGSLVPVIGLVQAGVQSMADRYTYIPYIGLFIMTFWLLDDFRKKNHDIALNIFLSGIIIIMAVLTVYQVRLWKNSITLFQHSIKAVPENYIAHSNLGQAILEKGNIFSEKASEHFKEAIRIKPDFAVAHLNLGVCYSAAGNNEKALESYMDAIRIKPDYAAAYCNIGNIYFRKGNYNEALAYYKKTVEIDPANGNAYKGLGAVYANTGDTDRAIFFLGKARLLMPKDISVKAGYENLMKIRTQKDNQ